MTSFWVLVDFTGTAKDPPPKPHSDTCSAVEKTVIYDRKHRGEKQEKSTKHLHQDRDNKKDEVAPLIVSL